MKDCSDAGSSVLNGVHHLLRTAAGHPGADDAGMVELLVDSGLDRNVADRLVVFVPLAFGRYVLDRLGVRYGETYYRLLNDGTLSEPLPLMDVPEFRVALEHRDHLVGNPGFKELAGWSAEVGCVNEALNEGVEPADGEMTEPVVWWGNE